MKNLHQVPIYSYWVKASTKGNGTIIPELDLAQMSVLFTHVKTY